MVRREITMAVQQSAAAPARSSSRLTALALVLGLMAAPAATMAATLTVTGGPGLDQGQICVTGNLCPGTPAFSLVGAAPVTGSFTYNAGPQTVDFSLTLTAPANFGAVSLVAGSTFTATGVPVIALPFGGGIQVVQVGAATGSASPFGVTAPFGVLASSPAISALTCSIGTGADQCGVSLGAAGFQLSGPGGPGVYDTFVTFNVNVVPVPAAVWLFGSALGLMGIMRRRAAA
jgi:hypothetical protein